MKRIIACAALSLSALAFMGAKPAVAQEYKYCLYEGRFNAGDCSFRTFGQCQASASGRVADCRINPRWAYERQPRRREW